MASPSNLHSNGMCVLIKETWAVRTNVSNVLKVKCSKKILCITCVVALDKKKKKRLVTVKILITRKKLSNEQSMLK